MADNPFADLIPQSQANPFVAQGRPDDSDFATAIQDAGERSPESAVSPKGARGAMQVMPGTVAAPGFGVAPATSEADLDREGRDYSQAMLRRYGDARLAAAAYDAGPGTVDDWLEGTNRTGRNPKLHRIDDPRTTSVGASWLSQIPFKETRDYVGRVAGWLGNAVVPSAQAEELGNPFADLVPKKAAPAAANPFADLVPTTPLAPRAAEPPDTGLLAAPFAGLQEALRGSMQSAQAIGATGPLAPVTKRLAGAGASAMEEGADALHWLSTRVPGGDMLQSVSDWMRPVSGRGPEPGPTVASQPLTLAGPLNVKSVAEKTLYGLGESAPTVAGAVAGGVPGAVTAAVMQSYGRNLEAHNGDVGAAAVDTAIDAAFTGLGFKAFEYTPFKSTVKDLLAQGLAIQPAIAMTERAVMNVRDGRPATEGLPDEYLQGALPNTLTMGLAHLAAAGVKPEIVAIQPAKGEAQAPAPLPSGPKGGPPPSPASAAQPVEPVLQTGSVIGLNTPAGVPRRAEVVGSFENGRYTTLRFEDGSHRDFRTEEVMRDRTEAPPRAQESATPTVGVEPVSEAERFDLEGDYLPPQAPRVFPQPVGLGTEAIHGLDQARGLELAALDTTNKIPNAQRQDMLAEAARLRRLYGAPEESQPESYRHPLAAEPARGLGELAAARVARPELYEPQSPEDARASQAIDKQAATTETAPSDAQKEAGNYRKGQIKVQGMDVSIETPRNAERTGISPEGEPWANRNPLAHYGYIKRTAGADGDHVDAYVGPHPGNPFVYVVDQVDPRTGVFDEHKAVIGAGSERQARAIYDAGFSDGSGPDRLGAISKVPVAEFKDWLKTGDTKTPFNPMADPEFRNAVQEIRDARSTSRQSADILSTIVAMGGIRLTDHTGRTTPEGQTVAQILQDYRRPGLVNNRNGMTPDYLREALTQQGWFGDRDPTQTELQPFYDMLDRAARGEKIYHPESGEQDAAGRRALMDEEMGRAGIAKSDSLPDAAKKLLEFRRQGIEELAGKYEDRAQEYVSEMSPASQAALVEYGYEPGADIGAEYETEAELPQPHGAPETARAAEPAVSGPELGREGAGEPEGGIPPQAQVAAEPVDLGRGVTAEQTLIPGTERSARQLAAAREAQGHGRKATRAEQREPEGLFAEKPHGQETLFQAQRGEAQGPAPGQRVKIGPDLIATLPDNPDARERAILNNVSAMMRKIVPTAKVIPARRLEVGQAFREQSRSTPGGEITGANFTNGMRRIITWSLSSPDAIGTGRHEAIHYLKSANFFTPAEWKALVHGAMQGDWIAKHDIEARYPDAPLELKTEEAIAEEFGQWQRAGTQGAPSRIASAFEKMRALFSRVSDYMRRAVGADVTADNVFSRIRSGEMGARSLQTRMERVEPSAYQAQANRPIPEAPETMPEGREYFDNVADALGEHLKEKGAGTYARRMAAGFSDTLGRPSKYLSGLLGSVEREIIFPRTLSATDWRSAKYWDTNVRKLDETARLLHEAAEGSRRYIDLSTAQRAKLHAVEELVRLKGITLDDDGRTIVMRNDIGITRDGLLGSTEGRIASLLQDRGLEAKAARDAAAEVKKDNDAVTARVLDYLNPPLAHSRFGQTIELDGDTSKAFFERRDLFRQRWRDLMRGAAKRLGWDGEPDPDAIRRAIADRPHDEGFRKSKERIATLLDDMKAQERQGYVPLMRFGDYFISVTPKIGKDEESLGGFPRVAHFELVDSAPSFLESVESGTVRREGEVPKSAQEKIAELRATYPESAYDIEHDYVSRRPERLRDLDVPAVEKMLTLLSQKDTDLFGPMVEELRDKFYEEMRAGFKKRSYSVPGYSPDFARAAGAYMHWTANHVADMVHGEDIRAAEEHYINAHPDPGTRQYWKDWKAYQESPAEQMRKLQKFGFYWELAGNLSSSAAIALHGPMVGTFTLGVGLGPTKTGVGRAASFLYPALGRIVRAIRADSSRGLYIDTSEIKGLSPKERVALDKADRSGLLHSAATEELAGMSQQGSEALTPKSKFWRRAGNIAGSNIAVVDRMNRMGIWLAAYRMAQNPSIRETWAKTWGDNQVFSELTARDGMTPETLARFMVDEGAFVWGKTNRPKFARGEFGALITTFRGFEMNYLSTLWKLGRRMGPSGKLSALAMMAALGGLAGAQGLPFVQDVEGASEWLSKLLTGVDPMIEAHLYRFMEDAGFSKTGAEMVLKGAPRSALGIDLSNRLGFGNIATKDLGQNPLAALGAVPGIVYNAVTSAENRAAHGQPIGASAAMLPAALRNPVEGLAVYPTEGVRTQYQHPWQPAVVAPKDLGIYDELVRGAGFEPANVARAYEQREFYRRLGDAMRARAAARVRSGSGVPASVRGVPNPYP